jgi:hypothetical protein
MRKLSDFDAEYEELAKKKRKEARYKRDLEEAKKAYGFRKEDVDMAKSN